MSLSTAEKNMRQISATIIAAIVLLGCYPTVGSAQTSEVQSADEAIVCDIAVYGGTSAGVMAAVQAKRMGHSVVIVGPDIHLGGLSSSGLGWTDSGNKAVIGGLAREFYQHIYQHYAQESAWKWQPRDEYGNQGQGTPAIDGDQRTMWIFEPHVAEQVFDEIVKEHEIPVFRNEWLDRSAGGVTKVDGQLTTIRMLSGLTIGARAFIDATYEGDLMAAAGVAFHVGRESRAEYGEEWNGVQTGVLHHGHHFGAVSQPISPYVIPGDPTSGLLPRISPDPPGEYGAADNRVQAYCYRMCLTDDPRNRVPFPKPDGYDAGQYELLLRILKAGWREGFRKFDPIPNRKTDTNNHGPFSTDNIGYNYDYPEGSYERRQEILREHKLYQKGLMYFLANDPRVPADVRQKFNQWGLAADEFIDNDNWPHQIYVREARRMIGEFVMTEHELLKRRPTPQSIGMGSYAMDSHNVQRYVTPDGYVQNEGDIGVSTRGPYEIAYRSILPKKDQCQNLVVPVCLSSSHIAYGSIRMEPVFMILGQSAATTAALAVSQNLAVQDVAYEQVRARLLADGQVLEYTQPELGKSGIDPKQLPGTVVDDTAANIVGNWSGSTSAGKYIGREYLHDGMAKDGRAVAVFQAQLPDGRYEVRMSYPHHANRATNVPVTIQHAGGIEEVVVNQQQPPPDENLWLSLGEYEFNAESPATVTVSNRATDGYVIVDAIQFLPIEKNAKASKPNARALVATESTIPDIRSLAPDLSLPPLGEGPPEAGKRVKHQWAEDLGTELYHVLYLPTNFQAGRLYPIIVEFSGNGGYHNQYGDTSLGIPEGSCLGYGMSGGRDCLWLCLPFLTDEAHLATRWWGRPPKYDPAATVDYVKRSVASLCRDFGGDSKRVLLCGFSRGAIACNFIGLHDDQIASLWCGFVAYSHYDGVRDWGYPGADAESAKSRLKRLAMRPQFICHEVTEDKQQGLQATRAFLAATGVAGEFTFAETGFRNHNDAWILRDSPARQQLRNWLDELWENPSL
jgi:hypothetical protein